jgi:DNA polymerase-3 subunit beta
VPARNFIDLVNSLPPDQVDLTLDEQLQLLSLACGSVKASFRGISAEEFPVVPAPEESNGFAAEAGDLRVGLGQVIFAASTDESHPVLTGVLAEFAEDTLTLAAADGFRLSHAPHPADSPRPAGRSASSSRPARSPKCCALLAARRSRSPYLPPTSTIRFCSR